MSNAASKGAGREIGEVRGDDRISPAHDSGSDDVAVPGIGQLDGGNE
jgi:hypothetical protein